MFMARLSVRHRAQQLMRFEAWIFGLVTDCKGTSLRHAELRGKVDVEALNAQVWEDTLPRCVAGFSLGKCAKAD